jgi:dihydroneopterin aldolase
MQHFTIELSRIHVHASIGAQAEEQVLGQSLFIDLVLSVHAPLGADQVAETLDYGKVIEAVQYYAAGAGRIKLVETFADRLGRHLIESFAQITTVRITVEKSYVPVRDFLGQVRVTMERSRH